MSTSSEKEPISIKELLIKATFAPNRALRPGVEVIDLGILGEEAERLHDLSATGTKIEYMLPAIITSDRKIKLRKEDIHGSGKSVAYLMKIRLERNYTRLPKEKRQEYFLAVGIHNHPVPTPPSPCDLGGLFLSDENPIASTAVFTSSEAEKIVLFRGENTPGWTRDFIDQKVISWDKMIEERAFASLRPNMLMREQTQTNRRVQMAWLRDVVAKYDLQAFSCPIRENIARRMIFPQR
ncbi:MAG: hypothetical protein WCV81_02620 [Microgenomates group bacterium]|jgi:hypothetical protein